MLSAPVRQTLRVEGERGSPVLAVRWTTRQMNSSESTSLALPMLRLSRTELARAGRNRVAAMEFVSAQPHFAGAGLSFFWLV